MPRQFQTDYNFHLGRFGWACEGAGQNDHMALEKGRNTIVLSNSLFVVR